MSESTLMAMAERFLSALKHCQLLQMRVAQTNADGMTLVLPRSPAIVGNPQTGAVHGGALTTLMDTTCGMATLCVLPRFEVCPTLDLRIDYMHPAEPGKDIYGHAQCYRVTRDVIFTVARPTRRPRPADLPWWARSCARARDQGWHPLRQQPEGGRGMIPREVRQQLNAAHAVGDYRPLLALIPYAGLIGIECEREGDDLLFRLPASQTTSATRCCRPSTVG